MRHWITSSLLLLTVLSLLACVGCRRSTSATTRVDTPPPPVTPPPSRYIQADATCDYQLAEAALLADGWTKTFEDNFSTDGDLSRWNVWTGGAYNNELQYYQPANLMVKGGVLSIVAKKETVTGRAHPGTSAQKTFSYTSGRLECKSNISASAATPRVRMAARIRLARGYGMWPAFWSYGDPWPAQGEIDALEARGHEPNAYQTNYFYGPDSNLVRSATGYIQADEDLTLCYHVYELEWRQNALVSYLDGKKIEEKTSGGYIPAMFGKTQRIALNLAVGGAFFSNLDPARIETGVMEVDWVRVYTAP